MDRARAALMGAAAVLCLLLGLGGGYWLWGRQAPPEAPKPAQAQPDGSLVLERTAPAAPATTPLGNAKRHITVAAVGNDPNCVETTLDLQIVETPEGDRVVASSPNARVIGGTDRPVMPSRMSIASAIAAAAGRRPNALGLTYAGENAFGGFVHRDLWRMRLGLEVNGARAGGVEARVLVGWTW